MSLKEKVENHPIYVFGTALVLGFGAGFTTSEVFASLKATNAAYEKPMIQDDQGKNSIDAGDKKRTVFDPQKQPSNPDDPEVKPPPEDKQKEKVTNSGGWTLIKKAKGPLTFTFGSAKIEDTTLEATLYIGNSASKNIGFGLFINHYGMYKTVAMIEGKKYYPTSAELGGKYYKSDDFIVEDCPSEDKLLVSLKFEDVPAGSTPSLISIDYHYTVPGQGMEMDTQSFKYR